MAVHPGAISLQSTITFGVVATVAGVFPLFIAFLWLLFRVTTSRHGRLGTARWLTRALLPVGAGLFVGAIVASMPFLFWLAMIVLGMLMPLSFWRFVSSMSRQGTALHRRIYWHGPFLLALTVLNLLCIGGGLLIHVLMPASLLLTLPIALSGLSMLAPPILLLFLMSDLYRFWPNDATLPEDHVTAVVSSLREFGMDVTHETRSAEACAGDLSVRFDVSCAPARATIACPIPGLPPDLTIRARAPGDPPGVRLDDPLIDNLLYISGGDPELVVPLLRERHEDLLENLHAWPGSRIAEGHLYIQMDGPPFTNPRSKVQDHTPSPENSAAAVLSQVHSAMALVDHLQSSVTPGQSHQRQRQPLADLQR